MFCAGPDLIVYAVLMAIAWRFASDLLKFSKLTSLEKVTKNPGLQKTLDIFCRKEGRNKKVIKEEFGTIVLSKLINLHVIKKIRAQIRASIWEKNS